MALISRTPSFSFYEPSLTPQLSPVFQVSQQHSYWFIFLSLLLFIIGLVLGYLLDRRWKLVQRMYTSLQKSYPAWYASWPADRRERRLALFLGLLLLFPFVFVAVVGVLPSPWGWSPLFCSLGLALGINIQAAMHFRRMLLEDRPEQPPQAVLHKVNPKYSMRRALFIGQLYLRLLLPVFALFLMLVLPLSYELIVLSGLELTLLLISLFVGAGLAWWAQEESHFEIERFRSDVLRLSGLGLLSAALLLFGLASGNDLQLLLMGAFSAYLAGLY